MVMHPLAMHSIAPLDRPRARRSYNSQDGIREYEAKNHDYLQQQIGNPDGADKPNKKYYDPREMMRSAEVSTVDRLKQCFEDLNCIGRLGLGPALTVCGLQHPRPHIRVLL